MASNRSTRLRSLSRFLRAARPTHCRPTTLCQDADVFVPALGTTDFYRARWEFGEAVVEVGDGWCRVVGVVGQFAVRKQSHGALRIFLRWVVTKLGEWEAERRGIV